ncbi:hypothetical protein [Methanoregula sp.]|uniref:hypothetical protein n=1 Tax=Methanoregula sp. TaxID=2052170 RepID=UPI002BB1D197|nr:hypothetical protein [Methanoregula sp.]HVP96092.1 hypothetical protein [Methanoregula sp.]
MISVAYINDDQAMLEYGKKSLEYLGACQVETFENLKYSSDWFMFHTYDVIIFKEDSTSPGTADRILSVLPYGDTTPVIMLMDFVCSVRTPRNQTPLQPVILFRIHTNLLEFFFELHQLIEQVVSRQKITDSMMSIDYLLKRFGLLPENTLEENIGVVVETCGRCLSAIFTAYHRTSDWTRTPVAVWYAGELPLRFALTDNALIDTRSRKIGKGRFSSGWTCSPEGRIEWAGKDGMFSIVLYPVLRHEWQKGVLSIVFPSNRTPADHEFLMIETYADLISWNERMAPWPKEEVIA